MRSTRGARLRQPLRSSARRLLFFSFSVFVCFASREASADDAREDEDEEVLIRGHQQAAGFVSRRSIEDAPREITDAASLIEPLPGVHVRRLGADDSFSTLSIRGSSSTQVAVYVAGVPLSGGADPTLDLATLPLWPGAQARVYRTFAPAGLGRGSLGGTLVLDPPSPKTISTSSRTEVWDAVGSYGALRLRIGDVRRLDPRDDDSVRVATGISASRSDDDFTYLDPDATTAAGHDVYVTRNNSGHAAAAGLASVAIPIRLEEGRRGALTITTLAQARRQELPGSITAPTNFQRLDSSRIIEALELTLPISSRRPSTFSARLWGRREGLALSDNPFSARRSFSPSSTDDTVVAAGTSIGVRGSPFGGASSDGARSHVELRVDGSGERYAPGTWVDGTRPPGATRTNAGVAFDGNVQIARIATFAASARGDMWIDASSDGAADKTELRPTGNVGVEVPLAGETLALASHAGFVARPPTFVERYGNRGSFIGNASIKTESAFTIDAGARFARRFGPLRLQAESSGFATFADDLIVFRFRGANGRSEAVNIGEARLYGIESEVRAGAYGVDLRASHTGLATKNGSECKFLGAQCERPPLPGRPEHDLVVDLAYEHPKTHVRVRYGIDLVAGLFADDVGLIPVPTRVLHGASVTSPVPGAKGLSLTLDVRNLFDLRVGDYPAAFGGTIRYPIGDLYNFPLPGRRVMLSARWLFGD